MGRVSGLALAVALGLVAGCTPVHWVYEKPRMNATELDRDKASCRAEVPSGGFFTIFMQQENVDRPAFNRCMARRGYTVRQGG